MARASGDVDVFGMATLLQALNMARAEGILAVECQGARKVLEIAPTGIRLLRGARPARPLGEILLRAGRISATQLEEFLAEQRRTERPLGEILGTRGIVPPSLVESALRRQVADEVYEIFDWSKASFEFNTRDHVQEEAGDTPLASVVLNADIMYIMLEAARRVDELGRIRSLIPDERLMPQLVELPGVLEDPAVDHLALEEVVPLIDGTRSVKEIVECAIHPEFTVLRTLYGLVSAGVIKIQDCGDPIQGPITVLSRSKPEQGMSQGRRGRTVLLLIDSQDLRLNLAMLLLGEGYDVLDERFPSDLDRMFAQPRPDVVVLDESLESPEGLERCAQIRARMDAPLILLASSTAPAILSRAMASGARFVLLKPLDEKLFLRRIEEAAGR